MQNPDTDPRKHSQLIFDKGTKAILWKKDSFIKWCWNNCEPTRKMNLDTDLTPVTEIKMNDGPKCKIQNYKTPRTREKI